MNKLDLINLNDQVHSYLMHSLGLENPGRLELYLGSIPGPQALLELEQTGVYDYLDDLTSSENYSYTINLHRNEAWATPMVEEAGW